MTGVDLEFRALADSMMNIVWTADIAGVSTYFNRRWYEYTGIPEGYLSPELQMSIIHKDEASGWLQAWQRAVSEQCDFHYEYRLRCHDNVYRWFLTRATPFRDLTGRLIKWIGTSTDIDHQKRADEHFNFLTLVMPALTRSLDVHEIARNLANVCLPYCADRLSLYLQPIDSDPELLSFCTRNREVAYANLELQWRFPAQNSEAICAQLNAHGTRCIVPTDPHTLAELSLGDEEVAAAHRMMGLLGGIIAPVRGENHCFGTLVIYYDRSSERKYTDNDWWLAESIASRLAIALEIAILYQREHRVAVMFQEAALPKSLPTMPGITLSTHYTAGRSEFLIGGDWYDALRLDDGRLIVTIGDVSGSGLNAAVTMASVRLALRSVAMVNPDPLMMLEAAEKALQADHPEMIVTAFIGLYDPIADTFTYSCAGHPPPILMSVEGVMSELATGGLPLGLFDRKAMTKRVHIAPGARLVLYTDGLVEAKRDLFASEKKLFAIIPMLSPRRADRWAAAIYNHLIDEMSNDDIAILTINFQRDTTCTRHWTMDTKDSEAACRIRRDMEHILKNCEFEEADLRDAFVVFSELVGNAVRYASGLLEIALDFSSRYPVLHVRDNGMGFRFASRLPRDLMSERGRGLFLVTSISRGFTVEMRPEGGAHARAILNRSA